MSANAIALNGSHAPLSFCDKSFKTLRVTAGSVKGCVLALCYEIIAKATYIFNAQISHRYHSYARRELKSCHKWFNFQIYGKEIVDFSVNSFTRVKELSPPGKEMHFLKKMYGSKSVDEICQVWPEKEMEKKLSRKEMHAPCCFGMSYEFISAYLNQVQQGKTSLEVAKSIAPHFANGASDPAQLCQMVYSTLTDSFQSKLKNKELNASQITFYEVFRGGLGKIIKQIGHHFFQIQAGRSFGMVVHNDGSSAAKEGFADFFADLPAGAYIIGINPFQHKKGEGAHAMAFIKTEEGKDLLFDSNRATFAVDREKVSTRLWDIVTDYASKSFGLVATPCTLA
jgi:hypothetical protein